jgi:hypothetical protein
MPPAVTLTTVNFAHEFYEVPRKAVTREMFTALSIINGWSL